MATLVCVEPTMQKYCEVQFSSTKLSCHLRSHALMVSITWSMSDWPELFFLRFPPVPLKIIQQPSAYFKQMVWDCLLFKTKRDWLNTLLLPWVWWTERECKSERIILQIYLIFSPNPQHSPPALHRCCDFIFSRPPSHHQSLSEAWSVSDSSALGTAGRQALWLLQHAPH